jgi:lysyl-tRNA synthetase class 2
MPSTARRDATYRAPERELEIVFTSGRHYVYRDVPPRVAEGLRAAPSKGRYFNAHIRDRYGFTELAGDPA